MFEHLFKRRSAVVRHREIPLREDRLAYLTHLANQGYARNTLRQTAGGLAVIVTTLGLSSGHRSLIRRDEVRRKVSCQRLFCLAVRWLEFMGRLQQRPKDLTPCAKKIKAFADYMRDEAELSDGTIYSFSSRIKSLLNRLHVKKDSLHGITPHQIDMAFQKLLESGGLSRKTIRNYATALRAFFRFAEARGWCDRGLANSIRNPRVFSQASLPLGPSWDDVRRLLATTEGDQWHNIRARPILMLLAIYGLRGGEVGRLRIEDFDWEHEVFRVISSKTGRVRTYPLMRTVGDAILRYLREMRPRSPHRELFLSLSAPFRPMRRMWPIVYKRMRSLQVSLPHYGPHALRHACATRLLAAGLSLKEIGDQLGHVDPESTRIYAKVDLAGLREVADFDLGGVL